MKKMILVGVLSALSSASNAAEVTQADVCRELGDLSVKIMTARQNGIPLSTMLEALNDDTAVANHMKQVIIEAYKQPRYSTDEMRARTIEDFRNDVELECFQAAN
ncbi:hypothetical protein HGP28_08975 [Vibrio sp. SM6]|uniref:Uncharacterized protein n=1 Tax=Vibrio agarilyticus TaxID=2726741 RepID=A0A7X8TQR2_9VIBR|nr:hypothetical protein [Vibrio agarilyticus]NLS13019.1 hypothetical protein [Vibrio agarilyticus]